MKFIIGAPPYRHNSAGVRVLYRLGELLRDRDYEVFFISPVGSTLMSDEVVTVYPETVPRNPLGANKVVRYLLNEPGLLGGDKEYPKEDLLVVYNPGHAMFANGELLQIPVIEDFFIPPPNGIKSLDCFWVGRGKNLNLHPIPCREITSTFPDSRVGVARLLQSTRTLYTYDNFTCIVEEALRCGCGVVYISPNGTKHTTMFEESLYPTKEQVDNQLTIFINRCLAKWFAK